MTADKKLRFVNIRLHSGSNYTQPISSLTPLEDELAEATIGEKWTLTLVEMTQAEYDALPEFVGH